MKYFFIPSGLVVSPVYTRSQFSRGILYITANCFHPQFCLSDTLEYRGAGSNLKVEGHGHYFRREAPEKIFRVPPPFLAGAPFDRGHQTKVWGTQRFDRYSSDCE